MKILSVTHDEPTKGTLIVKVQLGETTYTRTSNHFTSIVTWRSDKSLPKKESVQMETILLGKLKDKSYDLGIDDDTRSDLLPFIDQEKKTFL